MTWLRRGLRPTGRALPWAVVAIGLVLRALQLRGRAEALAALGPVSPAGGTGHVDGSGYELVVADGVRVDAATRDAAVARAAAEGLGVLELVPDDVDAERALELLRAVDPATYRADRLARGQGTAHAVVVSGDVLARAGGRPEAPVGEADLARLVVEAKRCAPGRADLVVAPGVRAAAPAPRRRRAELRALHGGMSGVALAVPFVGFAFLALGFVVAPLWAVAGLVAWCAQPALALRGTPLSAARARRGPGRPRLVLRRAVRVLGAPDEEGDRGRPGEQGLGGSSDDAGAAPTAEEVAGFFEERRATCPWCGSDDLVEQVTCTDVLQAKPGTFRLDRCRGCGHVFQNPRLSLAGLDFAYRDFYDGAGEEQLAGVFESSPRPYRGRAELVRRNLPAGTDPGSWLDVGTGHAHFCLLAAETFPATRFEALDLGDAVDTAARRGWVAEAHRGLFPDLAEGLVGRYDVVSMHHYLEHTREPAEELKAARRVLRPGGHLLIEVPDPECRAGSVLGRWWGPWFQPQHQHLVPLGNLCRALGEEGFEVLETERGPTHQPVELAMATWMVLNHLGPPTGAPWQAPATRTAQARRWAVFLAGAPVLALALLVDKLSGPVVARLPGGPNGYRVLARLR